MSKIIAGEQYNYKFPLKHAKHSIKSFKKNFKLEIKSASTDGQSIEFDMLNVPCIFHNTIRRLIINEVPSVAIDRIYLYNNTGVLEDSDLQLRIGLVPIDVNPDKLEVYGEQLPISDEDVTLFKKESSLLFELIIKHEKRAYLNKLLLEKLVGIDVASKYIDSTSKRVDMSVFSNDLKWVPLENQMETVGDVRVVEGILLDRLMGGEEIYMRCLAVKGYGHDHAKFMPVSAAHGRMSHKVELKEDIKGEDAYILQSLFPEGVIEIKKNKAVVANPLLIQRAHKNYNEIESLKGKVEMSFNENHYIWKIESVRPKNQPAHKILTAAFDAMIEKCTFYVSNIDQLSASLSEEQQTTPVKAGSFGKTLVGKFCYIDVLKVKGNSKFPIFHFIGETATLGTSLSYMITHKFGEEVMSAYSDINNGIALTLEILGTKVNVDSMDILKSSLQELAEYFGHMKTIFENKYSLFCSTDVDME